MAATGCLRWNLNRARVWLLPPPARCPRRALHKQKDGTEFKSIYSLDKLYPESQGSDTAWRVPVSREGLDGRGVLLGCWVALGTPGPLVRMWSYSGGLRDGRRGRGLAVGANLAGSGVLAVARDVQEPRRPAGYTSFGTASFSTFVSLVFKTKFQSQGEI